MTENPVAASDPLPAPQIPADQPAPSQLPDVSWVQWEEIRKHDTPSNHPAPRE